MNSVMDLRALLPLLLAAATLVRLGIRVAAPEVGLRGHVAIGPMCSALGWLAADEVGLPGAGTDGGESSERVRSMRRLFVGIT